MQACKRKRAPEAAQGGDKDDEGSEVVHKSKKCRIRDPAAEYHQELIAEMREDRESRKAQQEATNARLDAFMESSKKQGDAIRDALQGLLDIERQREREHNFMREMSYEI